ncbi:MAG: hypothetical protein HY320_12510 [Armatimonadetes bacterium]|nr:hypothetical protein [Armatimonadota bacterium]
MDHAERWQLATDLCARMAAKLGDGLIVGGVYGSTAWGTDTEWSDLELFFVVRGEPDEAAQHFVSRGIAVGYRAVAQSTLEALLTHPSRRWPFHMGILSTLKVLHGDPGQVQAWLRLGESVPQERFRTALEELLPDLVIESYGRILSCRERHDTRNIRACVQEVLYEMNLALCLLNRRWVTHDYYEGLVDAFTFPLLPDHYRTLVPALWDAAEINEIVPLAGRLVENFRRLLREKGIRLKDYQRVEDIPL